MINLSLNIRNPWHKGWSKNLYSTSFATPFKHKFVELECYKDGHVLSLMLGWNIRCDHAGVDIELGLFGYNVHFNFYDNRHWDYVNNTWEVYE